MFRLLIVALALLLGVINIFNQAAVAADAPVSSAKQLTLRDAVDRVLANNPDLKSNEFALKAAKSRIAQADLKPALELKLELENFAGTGALEGSDLLETTLSLSQVIELGGKRDKRRAAAEADQALAITDASIIKLDVMAEVTRRFLHLVSDQERFELTQRATQLAEQTVEAVQKRVKAAKSPEVELHRARIALTRAQIREEHAEHEMAASRRKLSAMWGDTEDVFGVAKADLFELPEFAEYPALVQKLERNPSISKFLTEARLHEAEMNVAESKRRSNIEVAGGVRRLEATEDHALVASVSIPLFAGRRALPAIEEESAEQQRAVIQHQSALVSANARLYEIYQELLHARMETTTLRADVLPQMEEALRQTEYAYQRGRYSYMEWVDAQHELLEIHQRLIESATNVHLFLIEVERLTGEATVLLEQKS